MTRQSNRHPEVGLDFVCGWINDINQNTRFQWTQLKRNDWNLIAGISNEAQISKGGSQLLLPPRSLTLISPGQLWDFESQPHWQACWFHFQPEAEVLWPELLPGVFQLRPNEEYFTRCLADLKEAWEVSRFLLQGWHSLALGLLETVIRRGNMRTHQASANPRMLEAASKLLNLNIPPPDILKLAEGCGLSRTRFYQQFTSTFGVTPRAYREQEEMRRVRKLLAESDSTLGEICAEIGWKDIFYLSRRFKALFGVTPSDFRKQH